MNVDVLLVGSVVVVQELAHNVSTKAKIVLAYHVQTNQIHAQNRYVPVVQQSQQFQQLVLVVVLQVGNVFIRPVNYVKG
jgi:hypothetical protein